ncbi:MAG: PAS domain S-box protein [Acidobacteria bacterium]|nr:PAS domain S-box protein [Acidobacteriota bacterium]
MLRSRSIGYGGTVLAVALATFVRLLLAPMLQREAPFLLFFPAIAACAWYSGLGAGILATLLSGLTGGVLLSAAGVPHFDTVTWLSTILFLVAGGFVSALTDRAHAWRRSARGDEDRLRTTLRSIGDAVIVTDLECRITFLNPVAEQLTGWSLAEACGRPVESVFRIVNEITREKVANPLARVIREGVILGLANHTVLVSKDGREIPIDDSGAPIRGDDGLLTGAVLVFRDISARRQAELEQARLAAIVESADDAIFAKTLDGIILTWNEGAQRIYGYTPEQTVGQPVAMLAPPSLSGQISDIMARLRRGERIEHFETCRVRRNGELFDVALTISPIRNARGEIVAASTVARDISDRRQAELVLQQNEERLRLALRGAQVGVWDWKLESNEVAWVGIEPIHGLAPGSFGGSFEAYMAEVHADDREHVRRSLAQALERRSPFDMEYRIVRPDGSIRWVQGKGEPRLGPDGRVVAMAGICMDVTARRAMEQERDELLAREKAARVRAETADRIKDEFLATLSHELRNPLNAVVGWARLLASGSLDTDKRERAIEIIKRNAEAQVQLVDDLLDVSRFITGKLRLDVKRVELQTVIASVIDASRVAAEAKGIALTSSFEPGAPPVAGDPDRLQQVFWNLLMNALKFTPGGGRIDVSLAVEGPDVVVRVRDSGRGIPAEALPYIFDRFRQADSGTTRVHGGLGLGLAVVRHLVEAHGGTVNAESAGVDQGATFTVTLPALVRGIQRHGAAGSGRVAARAGQPELPRARLDGLRILIVDDDPDARELLVQALQECGANVHAAESARVALERLAEVRPDAVVTDIAMPGMDGFALVREIRSAERGQRRLPVVALTGFARPEDRMHMLEAGFDVHFAKPVDLAELSGALAAVVGLSPPGRNGATLALRIHDRP